MSRRGCCCVNRCGCGGFGGGCGGFGGGGWGYNNCGFGGGFGFPLLLLLMFGGLGGGFGLGCRGGFGCF